MYNEDVKEFAKEEEKKLLSLDCRYFTEDSRRSVDRDPFMRDYARILYSSSFRRLQGKMQLLDIDPSKFTRNRLTHSLEVAQIARSIATDLGLENPVVAESASLAHDLGNPPFGHNGEKILNELIKDQGGFEGNAQTFRILRILEKKHHSFSGLNLTLRTMLSVTKYFNRKGLSNKKFIYDDDFQFLSDELNKRNIGIIKSIDAQIMDIADEIAYAAHDLEDALSMNYITMGELLHEFKISVEFKDAFDDISEIYEMVHKDALLSHRLCTSEEFALIERKELTSNIVNVLCNDIDIVKDDNSISLLGYRTKSKLAVGLKKLLFKAVLRKRNIQFYELKGENIIKGLFEVYTSALNRNNLLFPPEIRNLPDSKEKLAIDHIAGMMDSFAIQEYERFFGIGSANIIMK
ncbi:dGTP triphosphohydrolase [Dickeya dadantii]|uniref:dGTP triphosphohydrolase n=1 Tax=Dickeya dadantii TaxID=204038 RepID=UPI000577B19B|nr:dNTP triphosphohydrolase [Dickeya dadantii]